MGLPESYMEKEWDQPVVEVGEDGRVGMME